MLLALLLALGTSSGDGLDREALISGLNYGVSCDLDVQLPFNLDDDWEADLLERTRGEVHGVHSLERARDSFVKQDWPAFRQEIQVALEELVAGPRRGEAPSCDLVLLIGYGARMAMMHGGPAYLEWAEPILRDGYARDPTCWRSLYVLASMQRRAALQAGGEDAGALLERALSTCDLALEGHGEQKDLRLLRGLVRYLMQMREGGDVQEASCRAGLIDVWRECREAIEEGERRVRNRAAATTMLVAVFIRFAEDQGSAVPDDLLEVRPALIEDLEAALELGDYAGNAVTMLWMLHVHELGSDAEAEAYARALELCEEPALLRCLRLHFALKRGLCDVGLAAAEEDVAAADDDRTLVMAANTFLDCGRADDAEALLRERLEIDPSPELRLGLGVLLLRAGRDVEAIDALRAAVEEEAGMKAHWALGLGLAFAGEHAEALEHLRRASAVRDRPSPGLDDAIEAVERLLETADD